MAVIRRTEGMSIRVVQGIFLVLIAKGVQCNPATGCENARKDLEAAGLPATWGLPAPNGGETCGRTSCCSKQSEEEMLQESKRHLDTFIKDSIFKLSSLIETRAKKFDSLFREMMNTSKLEFHEMFQKTYGKIYLQNSEVFSDFFMELENYYKKGSTKLSETLESFFIILFKRMFIVINAQYDFDDVYLECVSDNMWKVNPFGDVPRKFITQLKRAFIATRTYYKALLTVSEAGKRLVNVAIDKDCDKEMVQMRFCGSCKGMRGVGICSGYCAAVLQRCLRNHVEFSQEWDNFIESLDKIAQRLIGPYNIENVVEPLNIKISEAIMNFQDAGADVSQKIFNSCGKPVLNRRRRDADDDDDPTYEIKKYPPMKKLNKVRKKKKNKKVPDEDGGPSLERLVKEIRAKIMDTRQFWSHLPYQYCNNLTASPSSDGNCWNGTSIGSFASPRSLPSGNSSIVKDQTYVLQQFTDQLRNAYNGDEVQFIDDSDDTFDGSGSGSGDFEIDRTEPEEEEKKVPKEDDDFEAIDEVPRVESPATTEKAKTGGAATMSLNRALAQFLLPIVLVWLGGAITDLL